MKKHLPLSFYFVFIVFLLTIFVAKLPTTVAAAASHIVISEVQPGLTGATTNEFIELYNPTNTNIDVTGWRLAKKTASASATEEDFVSNFPAKTINAHGFLLIAHTDYDGVAIPEDITYSENPFAGNNTLLLYDSSDVLVDKVGMGTAADVETAAKGNPSSGDSIERKATSTSTGTTLGVGGTEETAGNGEDTNNNSADFVNRGEPQPQNMNAAVEPALTPTPSVSPTASPSVSPTGSVSPTMTPTGSLTPTPSLTATPSVTGSLTPSPTGTVSPTVTPTVTLTTTPSLTLTSTPSPTASVSATSSPTATLSPTSSLSPTVTPSSTSTPTTTPTATITATATLTVTPTVSLSPTATMTPTATVTSTQTTTPTITPTMTTTTTVSVTPSVTPIVTHTPTPTPGGQVFGTFIFPNKTVVCTVDAKVKVRKFFIIFIPVFRCFEI